MIADLKPYPAYKESGIPWIGIVPSDWRVERTKCIFRSRKELNVGRQNTNVLSLTLRGVVNNDPESPEGMVPKDYATYQLFKKHDLVFKLIDLENIRTSRVGLVHEDGIMSSAYVRLAPTKSVNIRFFYLQFFDLYTRAVFNTLGAGVRSTLGAADLGELRIVIPPPAEQTAIVRFLDLWNGRLEKAIRSKRRVIALLQEQKQAIIHRAVTRGLDPNVKLKDSGIPWLGEIPEHWEARKLGSLFLRHGSGTTPSGDAYYGGGVPWVMSGDLKDGILATTKRTVTESALNDFSALKLHPKGSLLVAMYGATIGKTGVLNMAACSNQACCALASPRPQVNPVFIQSIVIMARPHLMQQAYGGGQPNINAEVVRSLRVPLPPSVEQDSILAYVDRATAPIGTAIARFEREITLLREYRTRLTADVVTGKLDVRAAAAQMPDPEDALAEAENFEEEPELEEVEG
jgi:type I restriction enzyme S subunit